MANKKSLWLRLYTEVLNDPKVQRLDGETFKGWINLLCVAKEYSDDGILPPLADISFYLRMSESDTKYLLDMLIRANLIEITNDEYTIHAWSQRQYESDNDPTAALRKQRQRERDRLDESKKDVTDESRVTSRMCHGQCHENVTRTETETETETDNINIPTVPDADAPVVEAVVCVEHTEKPKAARAKGLVPKPSEPKDELYHKVLKTFEAVSGQFANYGKEGAAIKRIIKLAGDEPTVGAMLGAYYRLTKSGDRFWSRQPYTPSALLSLWDRVKVEAQHELERHDISWIDELEAAHAAG